MFREEWRMQDQGHIPQVDSKSTELYPQQPVAAEADLRVPLWAAFSGGKAHPVSEGKTHSTSSRRGGAGLGLSVPAGPGSPGAAQGWVQGILCFLHQGGREASR